MRRSPRNLASPRERPRCACTGPGRNCASACSRSAPSRMTRKGPLMRCEDVALQLAEAADGSEMVDRSVLAHVEHCLRCQAEAVQYRRLLKALRHLRTQVIEPAP